MNMCTFLQKKKKKKEKKSNYVVLGKAICADSLKVCLYLSMMSVNLCVLCCNISSLITSSPPLNVMTITV